MCCFSRPVRHVSKTQIFARAAPGSRQLLAYAMTLSADEDLAMVLPLPVPPGSPEDAVRFIDLEGYPELFGDLGRAFPAFYPVARKSMGLLTRSVAVQPKLVVHEVGRFEASFVPRISDFGRLDARFRLPAGTWDAIPAYADFGFAVFKLRGWDKGFFGSLFGRSRTKTVHPIAFEFPRRDPAALFFPTVHVHDGAVHPEADFDHFLYWQTPWEGEPEDTEEQRVEPAALARHIDFERARGLLDAELTCVRRVLHGRRPNQDTYVGVT